MAIAKRPRRRRPRRDIQKSREGFDKKHNLSQVVGYTNYRYKEEIKDTLPQPGPTRVIVCFECKAAGRKPYTFTIPHDESTCPHGHPG